MSTSASSGPPPGASRGSPLLRGLRLLVLVPLARLRFLFILGAIGFVIVKWDEIVARYEKYVRQPTAEAGADPDHEFFCPMHPNVIRDNGKQKCPICFMPLSRRKKGEVSDEVLPAGTVSRVQLSPYRVVLAGVHTVPVGYQDLRKEIAAVGTIEFDERKVKAVAARVKGRIDKLFVNQTGQMVHKNDPLAELYSPDLIVTVQNLLDARSASNGVLERDARARLRLWGIDDAQVEEIVKRNKPITALTIRSPITGHILRKAVREGQYVEEGGLLFDVADLSTIWIQAQIYEDDLPFLPPEGHDRKTGRPAFALPITAIARAFPGRVFDGTLSFLFPHVDAETRTLTVRFELPNSNHELRPGMSATVFLHLSPELLGRTPAGAKLRVREGKVLAVPEAAVIDTGSRKVVYRETIPNTFDGVSVRLGTKMRDPEGVVYYPLLSGLEEGDRVVTAGSFLIDAETRLNPAAGSIYIGGSGSGNGSGRASTMVIRPTTPDDIAEKIAAAIARLVPEDRKLAQSQRLCPIRHEPLGSMGIPVKLHLKGQPVFVCCKGCVKDAQADPAQTLAQVEAYRNRKGVSLVPMPPAPLSKPPDPKLEAEDFAEIRKGLALLPASERQAAEAQRFCPILGKPLGLMGKPFKVELDGKRSIYVCCKSCVGKSRENPEAALKKAEALKKLPPILPEGKQ